MYRQLTESAVVFVLEDSVELCAKNAAVCDVSCDVEISRLNQITVVVINIVNACAALTLLVSVSKLLLRVHQHFHTFLK